MEGVEDERFILSNYRTPTGHFEEKSMFWNSRKKRGFVQQLEKRDRPVLNGFAKGGYPGTRV